MNLLVSRSPTCQGYETLLRAVVHGVGDDRFGHVLAQRQAGVDIAAEVDAGPDA